MLNDIVSYLLPILLSAVGAALLWLLKLAISKVGENTLYGQAIEVIRTAVNQVYYNVIKPRVEAATKPDSDGGSKITAAEAKLLRDEAWGEMLVLAKGPVKDFIVSKGRAWFDTKLEDLVTALKAKAAASLPSVVLANTEQ